MTEAYKDFTLLLAKVWEDPNQTAMALREIDVAGQGALLFGADPAGQRHVLAPITAEYAFTPLRGDAIELTEWRNPQNGQRCLDLVCRSEPLAQVFSLLADGVVARIQERQELPSAAIIGALDEWRRLLRPARELSEEAARGLFGELLVLGWLADRNPLYAVDCWEGPTGAPHDFVTVNGDLEVKTSASEGREVIISSLMQLDQPGDIPLGLVRLNVTASPQGKSLGDMVDGLAAKGCLRAALVERLEHAGFLVGVDQDDRRFVLAAPAVAWDVTPEFPGLRTGDLPEKRREAITGIKYTLDLVGAAGEMTSEELNHRLDRMMQT